MMKTTLVGIVGVSLAGLIVGLLLGSGTPLRAERVSAYEPSGQLIALPSQVDNTHQQIVVIDPLRRAMCIYHVDTPTGTVTLKSARNISGDLQIDEFNAIGPLPRDIRGQLEHRYGGDKGDVTHNGS
jgi:hypothetical protein